MTRTCSYCEAAPATATKREVELIEQDEAPDAEEITLHLICTKCAELWFDGTETYPALLSL